MYAEQKDLDRIASLIKRSKGDYNKLLKLSYNMAESITDKDNVAVCPEK
jgi:hypothetical protein